ncbi:MAG: ATP-binding protein [Candidatus Dormibacteria bacterium]
MSVLFSRVAGPRRPEDGGRQLVVAAVSLALLAAIFVGDLRTPRTESLGALSVLVVLASGWFLRPWQAFLVTAVALMLRGEALWLRAVEPLTTLVEALTLPVVVLAATTAARNAEAVRAGVERARGLRRLTDLLDTTRQLVGTADVEQALGQIVETVALLIPTSGRRPGRASLVRISDDRVHLVVERDSRVQFVGASVPMEAMPPLARVMFAGGTVTFGPEDLSGQASKLAGQAALQHCAAAVVRVAGHRWGALVLSLRQAHTFTRDELRLLEGMADLAGLAIGNTEAIRAERTRSAELQDHIGRMAELEAVKGDFLNLASHELRGPITVASGYVAMIEDGTLGEVPGTVRQVLPVVSRKLREMNSLVNHMLEVARLEEGRLRLEPEAFDLSQLVEETAELVAADRGGLREIPLDRVESLPVDADRSRIATVLANLVDNALKYSPADRAVHICCERENGSALVRVTDEGFGIAPEHLGKLFTRFGRIVTPENSHLPGTGLGLYLCRQLARQHGGDITVVTAPQQGSTFTLRLPIARSAEAAPGPPVLE